MAGSYPDYAQATEVKDDERNAAHQIYTIWFVAHRRCALGGIVGIKPL
jgi:hypothetical protein